MNSTIHAKISVKNYGGSIEDYNHLHDWMDCSKEVESSNKHRFLTHTMFFIKRVMVPIYGFTITNSDGKSVNLKDLLEQDHVLADYRGKFIPTLMDFACEIEKDNNDETILNHYHDDNAHFYKDNPDVEETMMLPYHLSGDYRALFATHNSWFVGYILPKVFKNMKGKLECNISPSHFFNKMAYKPWMQNGQGVPPSFEMMEKTKKTRVLEELAPKSVKPENVVIDGSRQFVVRELLQPVTDDFAKKPVEPEIPYFPRRLD